MSYTPRPGDYGVVKTNGFIGRLIRLTTTSRWNHAVIYIGDGALVEARPTGVTFGKVDEYPVIAWNQHEYILTDEQRKIIVDYAVDQIDKPYGYLDIFVIFLRAFGLKLPPTKLWVSLARRQGFICSELVSEAYEHANYSLSKKPDALVTPGDLAERLIYQ
jgi:YD repeat-containing protein